MQRVIWYDSPLGSMLLAADETGVTGVWFEGQKYFARTLEPGAPDTVSAQSALPALDAARRWLDVYFSGREPGFCVPLHLTGTVFQQSVWEILCAIPYGQTITYGEIAKRLAAQRGCARISAQAVGGAVGRNPVSIIVPCHRVIGAGAVFYSPYRNGAVAPACRRFGNLILAVCCMQHRFLCTYKVSFGYNAHSIILRK